MKDGETPPPPPPLLLLLIVVMLVWLGGSSERPSQSLTDGISHVTGSWRVYKITRMPVLC